MQAFLRDERYKQLGWLHDASWRLTGPFDGCACPDGTANGCVAGVNKGPHPAVRIYYSVGGGFVVDEQTAIADERAAEAVP